MLDFRVNTFIEVCKYMNFTRAAKELHITQPAVSQHIRFIEQEYGITLFCFQGKKMFLTEEGKLFLNVAATLKHDERALHRIFEERKTGQRKLLFGVTLTIGEYVIGKYLASYIRKYPETEVKLYIENTEELLKKLDEGEIDFAIVEGYFEKQKYDFQVFRKEKYIGVCAPGKISRAECGGFPELFQETLITREKGSGTREVLERALQEEGYHMGDFRHVVEIGNMNAIKAMTVEGGGVSFLYEAAVRRELEEGALVQLSVPGFPKYHDFTFIWRKNSVFSHIYTELFGEIL